MEYSINDRTIRYESTGEKRWGDNRVLLDDAIDLTAGTEWHGRGFTIEKFLPADHYPEFSKAVRNLLIRLWNEAGFSVNEDFPLQQYHTVVKDFESHLRAVEKTKLLTTDQFPIPIEIVAERISAICHVPLVAFNPFDKQSVFHFRIIRPQQSDNNPLHRDIWLEDYDNCINLYIPIAGSNERSSLILIPESHRWPEANVERTVSGAVIRGVKFNVPAVTGIKGSYSVQRPSPGDNEVLVFSPYLVHGGAVNLNTDKTRISIELRLWKK